MKTRLEQLEELAASDLNAVLGRTFLTKHVVAYDVYQNTTMDIYPDPPARVTIIRGELLWCGPWLDPVWYVESDDLRLQYSSMWCFGISYDCDGAVEESTIVGVNRPTQGD